MSSEHTVSWTKRPSYPSNRSRSVLQKKTVDRRAPKQLCQKCSLLGIQSVLQLFQLNDDEAILMCKNVDCTFMSSPQWENLIVSRNTSKLNSGIGTKKLSFPRKARSISGITHSVPTSTRQTHSLSSNTSLSGVHQSFVESSRSSSPFGELSKFEEEKQTLVPIAPFVCGQAHTFSSFETKRVEKEQLYSSRRPVSAVPFDQAFTSGDKPIAGNYRRPSSVGSESVSSGSLDSRPTSPSITQISNTTPGKKIRKVIVAPETLAKILDGSLQVKIVSSGKSKVKQVQHCYPVSHPSSLASVIDSITVANSNTIPKSTYKSTNTETPRRQPHQFIDKDTVAQSNFSHIQAINSLVDTEGVGSLDFTQFVPISQNSAGSSGARGF